MTEVEKRAPRRRVGRPGRRGGAGATNAVYFLAWIGALVFFWNQADSTGGYLLAVLKSLVWPAILLYDVFQILTG